MVAAADGGKLEAVSSGAKTLTSRPCACSPGKRSQLWTRRSSPIRKLLGHSQSSINALIRAASASMVKGFVTRLMC